MRFALATLVAAWMLPLSGPASAVQTRLSVLHVVDRVSEIVIEYGPVALPPTVDHSGMHEPPALVFVLPADGWMRGYSAEVIDGAERRLPSVLLHHMNLIAKNKRDLFSPVMLRIGAAGPETRAITLPRLVGVRMQRGDTLLMTLMLNNPTATRYDDVRLRVRVPFTRATSRVGALSIYPFSVAIGPKEQPNVFDLQPGRSEHYWEGSPAAAARILGVSGHLHRYGVELRLEDRTVRRVMWDAHPRSDSTGEVLAMPVEKFVWSMGKPIRPDHVYRLTAVYDNPEPRTIPGGGMGVLGGIVVLSRGSHWPAVAPHDPEYVGDVRAILGASNSASACASSTQPDAHHHTHPPRLAPAAPTPSSAPPSDPHASHVAQGCSSPPAPPPRAAPRP